MQLQRSTMILLLLLFSLSASASPLTILTGDGAAPPLRLAAAELRRYLADAGLERPLIASVSTPRALAARLAAGPSLLLLNATEAAVFGAPPPPALGFTLARPTEALTTITGTDAQHALFGAYAYLEHLGFTFTSAGPTIPARPSPPPPVGWASSAAPAFTTRGLQPFHDFAEGPDWWSEDEIKRVTEAILSMKGNLIGFHTYPLIEPAVWVGLAADVDSAGSVDSASAYPTRWATTHEPSEAWGYNVLDTSKFSFGASQLFEHECFGHPTVSGDAALCPQPATPGDAAELFNRVGALWKASFAHAAALGVQTVLGTEIPLSMPPPPAPPPPPSGATLPLQLWYSSTRNDHFITTTNCAECVGLYVFLGTTGWVYANNETGSTPLCTYAGTLSNGQIDNELAPCDHRGTGVRIEGYAPPSGSPGTAGLTQFRNAQGHHWAADAAWAANATANGFTAVGPLAPAFTTGPPVPAPLDAQNYYEGIFTRLTRLLGENLTYYWGWTPEGWEWDKVDINNPLIQDAVKDVQKMQAAHDAVSPPFALASCGWTVGPLGARWYYDTVLPSSWTISSIDMDVGNTPVDPAYANITHRPPGNKWAIPWAEDDPGLTAPELWVNRSLSHARDAAAYGVGGLLSIHWRTRMTSPQIGSAHAVAWNLSLTSTDYWGGWALGQFGDAGVAAAAAAVFVGVDSFSLPRPVNWIGGPGGMSPGGCNPGNTYAFVDALVAQRPALLTAIATGTARLAHLERFDYWAGQLVCACCFFVCLFFCSPRRPASSYSHPTHAPPKWQIGRHALHR